MDAEAKVKKLQAARQELHRRKGKLDIAVWAIENALLEVASEALGRGQDGCEGGDVWECEDEKNPIGMCVYDGYQDPCWDECLFCGEPYERK